jgi:outer membrane protein OmpA-like peptidoglycan-associated protein
MQGEGAITQQPKTAQGGPRWRSCLILIAIFAILLGGVVGGGVLVVRRIRSAYDSLRASLRQPPVAPQAAKPMALIRPCPAVPAAQLAELRKGQAAALIPLVPDLILDNTWVYYDADLEALDRVATVDDTEVKLTYSGPVAYQSNGKAVVQPSVVIPAYPQCQADLLGSHLLVTEGNPKLSIPLVGVTRIGVSSEVYQDLKAGRRTQFEYRSHFRQAGAGYAWGYDYHGEMQRDVLGAYRFKAIVNGTPTGLPAIHAMGQLNGNPVQMAVLDDAANPLLLDLEIATLQFALRVTKITYPVAKKIETDIQNTGRAEIYGIYFDFDSAAIRVESEPVLDEIADALRQNPDWRLQINGHTDSIGGDAHNMILSRDRAEAVKKALIGRYSIAPDRLATEGLGATQPKAANDTVEGRALNRRVELVKP